MDQKPASENPVSPNSDHGPKVLIVAQNASARMGGEAFLPLKYFEILKQRGIPATLIAHSRNRHELTEALPDFAEDMHFIADTALHQTTWSIGRRLPVALRPVLIGNLLNQINEYYQARLIRRLVSEGRVDIIHQPIPVSPRAPSRIHGFGVPVVIGPMNGNMSYPEGYADYESRATRLMIPAGRALGMIANLLIPGKRRADVLLVANGVDLSVWSMGDTSRAPAPPGRLRLVFMGRLIPLKGLDFTIEAIRLARESGADVTLDVLGDGP